MATTNEYIILNIGKRFVKIMAQEILYIVCKDYISSLTMADGRVLHISRSLQSFHKELKNHEFLYLSRDVMANMHYVTELQRMSARKWRALMSNRSVFYIAARRQKGFRDAFQTTRSPEKQTRSQVEYDTFTRKDDTLVN